MYKYLIWLLCLQMLGSVWCLGQVPSRVDSINQLLRNKDSSQVLVCAHRGDWRGAPENSLLAIKNCIDMGVDIVEIDLQQTKDGHYILMHDATLDRTTTGSGYVKDWPLDSIRAMRLRNGLNTPTNYRIPTLEEALELAQGNILLYLDKSMDRVPELLTFLKKKKMLDHAVFMLPYTYRQARKAFGKDLQKVNFIPRIELDVADPEAFITNYLRHFRPVGFQLRLPAETGPMVALISSIQDREMRVCVSTLWDYYCAGHDDDRAYEDPDAHWGWHIRKGVNIFNTDRPGPMLAYLRAHGLHP